MNENAIRPCDPTADYDQNTADMCDAVEGHLFLRGTTYQDHFHTWDARCIRCGQQVRLQRTGNGITVREAW